MNDVSIAYSIHQVFGFVCSLATLTVLCRQWYAIWREKQNGPSRSRYAVVRVQVVGTSQNGGDPNATNNGTRAGGTMGNGTGNGDTAAADDQQPVASTNGMTRVNNPMVDNREPDSRPSSSNDGNTQVLIRRWCAVAAVIQIVAFVDPYGVRGIYPLCMWRFTHNLITSDLHCLGLGVYFITSQVIYRLLNSKPHIMVVITLMTLATVTVIMGMTSPILQCVINESWTHALNLWWLAIVDLFWGIALTSNLRRLQHTLDVHARSSNKREALVKFQRFVFYSRIILVCLFVSFCFQIYTAIGVSNRQPIKGADPWHYSWMQQIFVYIQTLAILLSVSYLRRPTIRRRRAPEGSRTGGTQGVQLTTGGDGSPANIQHTDGNGPTVTLSGSPVVNPRRATAPSQLFVPSPRASGQGQFFTTIRSARQSGVNMFAISSPKNGGGAAAASGGSPSNGQRTLGGTLAIATSSKIHDTEKSIITPRSPGQGNGSPTGTSAVSPLGTTQVTMTTLSPGASHSLGSGHISNGNRGSLSVGRHMGGLLAVMENNAAASAAAATAIGGTLAINPERSPQGEKQTLFLSSSGSPVRGGSLAMSSSSSGQFLSPDHRPAVVDRGRLALLRMTSEHDLSPQHSPLSINAVAAPIGASSLAGSGNVTTPPPGGNSNGSHFTYGITPIAPQNNSPPTTGAVGGHIPVSPLPAAGPPRSPLRLSTNLGSSSNGGKQTPTPPASGRGIAASITPLPVGIIASHGPSSVASPGRTPHSAHSSRSSRLGGGAGGTGTQHIYGGEDTVGPLVTIGRRSTLPAGIATAAMTTTPATATAASSSPKLDATSALLHAVNNMPNTIAEVDHTENDDTNNDTAPLSPQR